MSGAVKSQQIIDKRYGCYAENDVFDYSQIAVHPRGCEANRETLSQNEPIRGSGALLGGLPSFGIIRSNLTCRFEKAQHQ